MRSGALILALGGALAAPGVAVAQTFIGNEVPALCAKFPGQALPPEEILVALLEHNSVAWSSRTLDAYQATVSGLGQSGQTLGDLINQGQGVPENLARLQNNLEELAEQASESEQGTSRFHVRLRDPTQSAEAVSRLYLRGDFGAMSVHCPTPDLTQIADSGGVEREQDEESRRLILTGDIPSLRNGDLGDRTFATFGYTNNAETSAESIEANLVMGFGEFRSGDFAWLPYVSYQRSTSSAQPLNDLSFGVTGFVDVGYHLLSGTIDFETDDEFRSEIVRAELAWDPPPLDLCANVFYFPTRLTCNYGLRADYAEISDPGDKTTLLPVSEYLRMGGWFNLTLGRTVGPGWLEGRLNYQLMEPLTGEEGDAAIGSFILSYSPSRRSNFSFDLGYEVGDDITSLVRREVLKVTLGLRY